MGEDNDLNLVQANLTTNLLQDESLLWDNEETISDNSLNDELNSFNMSTITISQETDVSLKEINSRESLNLLEEARNSRKKYYVLNIDKLP